MRDQTTAARNQYRGLRRTYSCSRLAECPLQFAPGDHSNAGGLRRSGVIRGDERRSLPLGKPGRKLLGGVRGICEQDPAPGEQTGKAQAQALERIRIGDRDGAGEAGGLDTAGETQADRKSTR